MSTLIIKKWVLMATIFISIVFSTTTFAGEFTCEQGKNFCQFKGKITQVYANTQTPLFMVYVDATLNATDAANNGIALSANRRSIALDDSNLELTKMALSTLQVAFVANKDVIIFVEGALRDYPKFTRVWVQQ